MAIASDGSPMMVGVSYDHRDGDEISDGWAGQAKDNAF